MTVTAIAPDPQLFPLLPEPTLAGLRTVGIDAFPIWSKAINGGVGTCWSSFAEL